MQPVTRITGPGIALPFDNVDTDQLIPARFMSRSREEGYGDQLLHDLRFDEHGAPVSDFPLNAVATAPSVLVAGANFGCGSSREAAVYALLDHGIGAVIAAGFADIFRGNAARNGLLTVVLDETDRRTLSDALEHAPGATVTVDLETSEIVGPADAIYRFDYDPAVRDRLLRGLDDLSATLEHEAEIDAFWSRHVSARPWVLPNGPSRRGP